MSKYKKRCLFLRHKKEKNIEKGFLYEVFLGQLSVIYLNTVWKDDSYYYNYD